MVYYIVPSYISLWAGEKIYIGDVNYCIYWPFNLVDSIAVIASVKILRRIPRRKKVPQMLHLLNWNRSH